MLLVRYLGRKCYFKRGSAQDVVAAGVGQRQHACGGRQRVRSKAVRVVMGADAAVQGFTPGLGKRPGSLAFSGAASRDAST